MDCHLAPAGDSESSDIDAPEDVGFQTSRTLAATQRGNELLSQRQAKEAKKSKAQNQQSWFHDQKVAKVMAAGKRAPKLAAKKVVGKVAEKMAKPLDEDDLMSEMSGGEKPEVSFKRPGKSLPVGTKSGPKLSQPDPEDEMDDELLDHDDFPDFIPIVDSKKDKSKSGNVKIKSLKRKVSYFRPEALKFAAERFLGKNVNRVPAAKIQSIASKRAARRLL